MKIEMGESLVYSWLRHVKNCQVVQTNWKVSPQWDLRHKDELQSLMSAADSLFEEKYGYKIFKKNSSLAQILAQGECDAIGISLRDGKATIFATEVAFHEAGLNYGNRNATVMKVVEKIIRTAMCLYGYMECSDAEISFASPKINPSIMNGLSPCMEDINQLFSNCGFSFRSSVIANQDFNLLILRPILSLSNDVADTSELFLRSYQMYKMFNAAEAPVVKKVSEYTEADLAAISEKAAYPLKTVLCPNCGAELLYRSVGASYEVKCPSGCIKETSRGL